MIFFLCIKKHIFFLYKKHNFFVCWILQLITECALDKQILTTQSSGDWAPSVQYFRLLTVFDKIHALTSTRPSSMNRGICFSYTKYISFSYCLRHSLLIQFDKVVHSKANVLKLSIWFVICNCCANSGTNESLRLSITWMKTSTE